MPFKLVMEQISKRKNSRVILALDLQPDNPETLLKKAQKILGAVHMHICAVKFNRHLILPLGLYNDVQRLVDQAKKYDLPLIMDCKINDIGNTNRTIAEHYFKAGFDAVTANPLVGWQDGLQPVFEVAEKMQHGVILLVYMSHRGAWEGYGQKVFNENTGEIIPQHRIFAEKALEWKADGVVVGSTYPSKIQEVQLTLKNEVPIYSPGIGTQGGIIEAALKNGAKYLIVGRTITLSQDPSKTAEGIKLAAQTCLS
ncbi:MAG: orotidine 5'-phosphate decarboxylase [Candidatus Bathyarchaeota archaeon]|nr:MAG: orotidine 5'-phosphate decarboxylase [Candidatus Bathyarchaeota archaeon]